MIEASNTSGGAAAGGGFDFQAALGAIAYIHALRRTPVHWTDSWTTSPPSAVSFETGGPGDDIALTLADGSTVEVQVKKGLTASALFWSALDSLCEGISSERCDYGILAVCSQSSLSVRKHYALAFRRLGDQRTDSPSQQQTKLKAFLADKGYDRRKGLLEDTYQNDFGTDRRQRRGDSSVLRTQACLCLLPSNQVRLERALPGRNVRNIYKRPKDIHQSHIRLADSRNRTLHTIK